MSRYSLSGYRAQRWLTADGILWLKSFHTSQRKDSYLINLFNLPAYLLVKRKSGLILFESSTPSSNSAQGRLTKRTWLITICGVFCPITSLSPRSHASFLAWSCGAVLFSPALSVTGQMPPGSASKHSFPRTWGRNFCPFPLLRWLWISLQPEIKDSQSKSSLQILVCPVYCFKNCLRFL